MLRRCSIRCPKCGWPVAGALLGFGYRASGETEVKCPWCEHRFKTKEDDNNENSKGKALS